MKELILIIVGSALVNNIILSQFQGLCPFLGVSKKVDTSIGMGAAVIFVITLASIATNLVYALVLVPLHLEYLETIVFILVIAALVQFVEMFLKKSMPSLYSALGVFLPLITTNCAVLGSALTNVQKGYNFIFSVANGLGTAVGFTIAIVLLASIRPGAGGQERLPGVLQGLPHCADFRRTAGACLHGLLRTDLMGGSRI